VSAWRYVYLLSSLPALPSLAGARALPIGEQRLHARLTLLEPPDARVLQETLELVSWRFQEPLASDADCIERLRATAERHSLAAVRSIAQFRLDMRLVVAALRYRRAGAVALPVALAHAGPLGAHLGRHFTEPELGLTNAQPWIAGARGYLEAADWVGLESLLLARAWQALTALDSNYRFAFENVLCYVLRYDILARRLGADPTRGAMKFAALLEETLHDCLAAVG
jgi:hypothetical protein